MHNLPRQRSSKGWNQFFQYFGGWLVLNEILTPRSLVGSILMLAGMIKSQIQNPTEDLPEEKLGECLKV